jgi:hypothetical protein
MFRDSFRALDLCTLARVALDQADAAAASAASRQAVLQLRGRERNARWRLLALPRAGLPGAAERDAGLLAEAGAPLRLARLPRLVVALGRHARSEVEDRTSSAPARSPVSPAAAAEGRRRRRRTAERGRRRRRGAHGVEAPALLGGELLPDPFPGPPSASSWNVVRPCSRTVRIRRDCSGGEVELALEVGERRLAWGEGGPGRRARRATGAAGGPGDDPRAKAARRASTPERWGFIA